MDPGDVMVLGDRGGGVPPEHFWRGRQVPLREFRLSASVCLGQDRALGVEIRNLNQARN